LFELNVTTVPPAGATTAICTKPPVEVPPMTVPGVKLNDSALAALIVNWAVAFGAPVCDAVIVAIVSVPTAEVVTVNVAVVAPPRTVTDEGTVALVVDEESDTVKPPAGAAVARVIVPVEVPPPVTTVGLRETVQLGTVTARLAVADWPPDVAVIVLVVFAPTVRVVIVKVPDVAPAATVAVAGTVAAEVLLDVNATDRPPAGAALPIVTVPVEIVPPVTDVGFTDRAVTIGGLTVRVAVLFVVPVAAVITGLDTVPTANVVTVKVAVVWLAGTTTEVGTVATPVRLEVRFTVVPPVGAGPLIVTVPVEGDPPVTGVGLRLKPLTVGASTVTLAVFEAPPDKVPVTVTTVLAVTVVVVAV